MIYLKPIGGLCNRMRSIDSAITLCEKYNQDLTILWIKNSGFNCSFNSIFNAPKSTNIEFKIVDCPYNFPEFYLYNSSNLRDENCYGYYVRQFKNFIKGRTLNKRLNRIKKDIRKAGSSNVFLNHEFAEIYFSGNFLSPLPSNQEMDIEFFSNVHSIIKKLFQNQHGYSYIESCFRLHPSDNNYLNFIPTKTINMRVSNIVKEFNNTIGLHIRRSDHIPAKKYSTTEKFILTINELLKSDVNTTIFLSSDDKLTKEKILSEFGDKIITNNVDSFNRNENTAIIDAVVDLYCLSKTKKIYGSYQSTFSQTAAIIGQIEEITIK